MLKEVFSAGERIFNKKVNQLLVYFAVYILGFIINIIAQAFINDFVIVLISLIAQVSIQLFALYKMNNALRAMVTVFGGVVSIAKLSCEFDDLIGSVVEDKKKTKRNVHKVSKK